MLPKWAIASLKGFLFNISKTLKTVQVAPKKVLHYRIQNLVKKTDICRSFFFINITQYA